MLPDEKKAQRTAALAARCALSEAQRSEKSAAICRRLTELPELQNARCILSYAAAGAEAELTALHDWARRQGKRLAFPVPLPGGVMEAWEPRDAESWTTGRFGLSEPARERSDPVAPETIDAVIVPCVAFDAAGRRLGHGAGYYDRYLPQCTHARFVAAAFEAQRLARVCVTDLDTAMHAVVTEDRVYRF